MTPAINIPRSLATTSIEDRPCRICSGERKAAGERWLIVVLYALAMAWVEAAVVFYIRSMIHRIEPYQATPLPIAGGLGLAETIREAATLIMLVTVGWLAGRTWRSRAAYATLAFGVWDIGYYLWLIPLTGWPHSLYDWDILFLIPLPWWGPVWAPVSIALLMIVFGTLVSRHDSDATPLWPRRQSCVALIGGVLLALRIFMADALRVVMAGGGTPQLRDLLPVTFEWPWFVLALALMSMSVFDLLLQARDRMPSNRGPFDFDRWLTHFARNREDRKEPGWQTPISMPAGLRAPLLRTLAQFQLGDGGGPCSLIAFNARRFLDASSGATELVNAWFGEEAEHSRLLGRAVERFSGKPITSHWSFTAFCLIRRWGGVCFELQVLLLTEIVSTAYYRVLRRHVDDDAICDMSTLILRDEGGHVALHCDRLAHAGHSPNGLTGALWKLQFWLCGGAAAWVLWINHGRCLKPFGATTAEFAAEAGREIGTFVKRLTRRCHELELTRASLAKPSADLTNVSA